MCLHPYLGNKMHGVHAALILINSPCFMLATEQMRESQTPGEGSLAAPNTHQFNSSFENPGAFPRPHAGCKPQRSRYQQLLAWRKEILSIIKLVHAAERGAATHTATAGAASVSPPFGGRYPSAHPRVKRLLGKVPSRLPWRHVMASMPSFGAVTCGLAAPCIHSNTSLWPHAALCRLPPAHNHRRAAMQACSAVLHSEA